MAAFFLALTACLLVTAAGRDPLRAARLSAVLGPGPGLLAGIWVSAVLSSSLAAFLGSLIAPELGSEPKQVFLAIALLLASLEVLLLRAGPPPQEPTRSTGAILLVLLGSQVTDAARFLVLALATATAQPALVGAGGALGSGAVLTLAVAAGARWERHIPARLLRQIAAAIFFVIALLIVISVRRPLL